jgi:membrane-bound lytic murein transglycosylase D
VDRERLEDAQRQAARNVGRLEESTREEFLELFGTDPLGLSRVPANAARYEIPLEMNEAVQGWIDYFQHDIPDRFATYLSRAERYAPMIRRKLRAAGLPQDLLYLSLIESGMNPHAYSRAHAVGLWQFIAGTARLYGLEVSYWVDERRDPEKATDAAIAYLSDLYDQFGSWYLAAAAYNGGPGRVRRSLDYTGEVDFWGLYETRALRRETRNYVPKLLAAATVARNAEAYGFDDVEPMEPERYDVVTVPDATSLDVIAEAAGTDEESVERLNPELRRRVTPPDRETRVKVPPGHGERFASNFAEIPPSERVTWLVHEVTRGQTLSGIASRYGTSARAISEANRGLDPRRLQIGQQLVIPRAARVPAGASSSADYASLRNRAERGSDGTLELTVRRGDTLWALARAYDVSTEELRRWNDLQGATIRPGDRLTVRR